MLAYRVLEADREAERCMMFLHGFLGRGQNWRSIARQVVEARRTWAAALVDLRLHGDSRHAPEPHTLQNTALDLDAVSGALAIPVSGVLGHSFGGKLALAWVAHLAKEDPERLGALDEMWIIDSPPGAAPAGASEEGEVGRILQRLSALEGPFQDRRQFVTALRHDGVSEGTALWLGTNLVRTDAGTFELGLDLPALRTLLDDYAHQDLWAELEHPPGHHQLHVVAGERSTIFTEGDRKRVAAIAASQPRVHLHTLPNAGHWVHVDAPDALVALLTGDLRRTSG